MKMLLIPVALLVSLLGTESVSISAEATQSGSNRAEDDVRQLSAKEVEAFLNKDAKTLARLWSDDFVVTNPLNQFVNKQRVLGMVESGVLALTSLDRQIEYARALGDIVILAGPETVVWAGKMPNAGKTEQLRFTEIWMKQGGRWQEVARHANIVPHRN